LTNSQYNKNKQTKKQTRNKTNTQKNYRLRNNRILATSSGVTPSASSPDVGI
jgi:hypothetical protein